MVTNTKHTLNKSCSCRSCLRGRGSSFGQVVRNANNRKLRRQGKQALSTVREPQPHGPRCAQRFHGAAECDCGEADAQDAALGPISSPYTD